MNNISENIIKALTLKIREQFTNIEVYSTDIDAGYNLPCFFIKINNVKTEKLSSKIDTLYVNLDVLYACEDKKHNQRECFGVAEKLRVMLLENPILLDNNVSFQIYEDSIEIEDDYIAISFDVEINLIKDIEEDLEYIENLDIPY